MYTIVLYYTYRDDIHQTQGECQLDFVCYPNFLNYLRWEPERAMQLGFGELDPQRVSTSRSSNVKLAMKFTESEMFFSDLRELDNFLFSNAFVAMSLGFNPNMRIPN